MFLNIFKHLLPNARAFQITINSQLREFFVGLSNSAIAIDVKTFFDEIWTDIDPQETRELDKWETQFGLRNTGLTEQERRDRLAATWQAVGGQDPRYIQDTLRAAGFDVYVHEWYVPGSEAAVGVKACATPRNPFLVLQDASGDVIYIPECGEVIAECGEADAEAGNKLNPPGYPLVNKIIRTFRGIISLAGEPLMECGETVATCGNYTDFVSERLEYAIPIDSAKWSYFLYIGGQTYGDIAQVDPKRKDEFEALCLKICPAQQWLGIIVEYV